MNNFCFMDLSFFKLSHLLLLAADNKKKEIVWSGFSEFLSNRSLLQDGRNLSVWNLRHLRLQPWVFQPKKSKELLGYMCYMLVTESTFSALLPLQTHGLFMKVKWACSWVWLVLLIFKTSTNQGFVSVVGSGWHTDLMVLFSDVKCKNKDSLSVTTFFWHTLPSELIVLGEYRFWASAGFESSCM